MKEGLCQCCGVRLEEVYHGTNADGSLNEEYCSHCLKDGFFTADFTMEETADYCAQFVDEYNQKHDKLFTRDSFKYTLEALLSMLKRWTLPADQLPSVAPISIQKPDVGEIEALGLPDCPRIPGLRVLLGGLINFEYNVNGNRVRVLDDNTYYWCMQVVKTDGSGRRYGFACGADYIVVNECGKAMENVRLVMIKRRR